MEEPASWVSAVAAMVALGFSLYTFRRQRRVESGSYLVLALALSRVSPDRIIASTSLENRSPDAKNLDVVFLLVSREDETPTDALNAILRDGDHGEVVDIQDFGVATKGLRAQCSADDRQYVRLEYYTVENSEVGDEILTYDAVLDASKLHSGAAYSVRLFLYGEDRLHRVVQRAIVG